MYTSGIALVCAYTYGHDSAYAYIHVWPRQSIEVNTLKRLCMIAPVCAYKRGNDPGNVRIYARA